ncbi:ribonuclease P protein component 1 [Halapricum hydrolyticum]|uniref:Ribonuclease P protein component 1 n=1 Tax=Halapricum hydrolyticum TaxID=2979991 RepID=A0AAE3I9F2_9EURY|nr:ribonuclease P protein component 1 [Halapricum hydrolyticum]MCU4717353.1 ribonuclease P protein component 1 [Halapricum hydrolyticum]MCU4726280.1 ribonuclease P protein component 1 [Halapricum hydrolyticum]
MTRTPETLARHELVGLDVRVTVASDPDLLDIEGEVVMETTNTLHVERADRAWQVPKAAATFAFTLPSGETVRIEGERLVARPARRTEHTGDSTWR